MRPLAALPLLIALAVPGPARAGDPAPKGKEPATIRVGAVAYAPSAVTIFEGVRRHFARHGQPLDYVLYSNYDALVKALHDGHVDVAWNTPLAHAQYHRLAGGRSQTLVMRDVDCDFRCVLVVRRDAGVALPAELHGKTLVLGSREAAEATVLPTHYLGKEGVDFDKVKVLSLDREVDLRGNPCSSEHHVFQALSKGRGDAGVISERLWKHLQAQQPEEVSRFKSVWTSPPFSHCVFTAAAGFDREAAETFTKLMLAMDSKDPQTAELMRLEGTRKWVKGSPDGFADLLKALADGSK